MKRPQTKFHARTMRVSQVIRSTKSQNLSLGQNLLLCQTFLAAVVSFKYGYLNEITTTDIDIVSQV